MSTRPRASLLYPIAAIATAVAASAQSPSAAPGGSLPAGVPRIHAEAPVPGALATGVAVIRFRTEHARIASLFAPAGPAADSVPPAHLHVTVDGTSWHWVHSTSDPVVIAPLAPGQHTVIMELAGADHRPLDTHTVRFTVAESGVAGGHAGHR